MKKILAYLLVLVSLMTLFCGTAGAEITFSKSGSAGIHVPIDITNLGQSRTKKEQQKG